MPVRGKRPRRAPGAAGDINTHYAQVIHYTPHTRILGVESTPGVMYNRNRNTTPNTAQEKKTNVQSTKRFYPKRRDDAERLENQQRPRHYNRVVGVPYISNRCDGRYMGVYTLCNRGPQTIREYNRVCRVHIRALHLTRTRHQGPGSHPAGPLP